MLTGRLQHYPYVSSRYPVLGRRGMVVTSQALAAAAGLQVLRDGGNAVDAAVATAIALTVVEPTSNGIGGDLFALVWDGSRVHGINGSGRAPAALTPEAVLAAGHERMPSMGWPSVTVPGAPRAWRDLSDRWGVLPFARLFDDAIAHATDGFPVPVKISRYWREAVVGAAYRTDDQYRGWLPVFAPTGSAPAAGELWSSLDHATTLRELAESGTDSLYGGTLAQRIEDFAQETGGFITRDDLQAHQSTWVDPISTSYRGVRLWEIPPNGQGLTALLALNILEGFDLRAHSRDSIESQHLQIEAIKLAFADTHRHVSDPDFAPDTHADLASQLLDRSYATSRRGLIGDLAGQYGTGFMPAGDTVYLCTADRDGMMVSLIQSNYGGTGSGIVVPGTGIALQNRGAAFTLESDHVNVLAPGKRPYHTIIPAFVTYDDGTPVGPLGVPGGHTQPQAHVQLLVNMVDYDLNPQAAIDASRWQWTQGLSVDIEHKSPAALVRGLADRGHQLTIREEGMFGSAQMIQALAGGGYLGACETRVDSVVATY